MLVMNLILMLLYIRGKSKKKKKTVNESFLQPNPGYKQVLDVMYVKYFNLDMIKN